MSERDLRQQRVKRLVAQDPEINTKQMEEFRMQLQRTLEFSEAKAVQTRRRIIVAIAVYFGGLFVLFWFMKMNSGHHSSTATGSDVMGWVYLVIYVTWLAAIIIGMLLFLLYLFLYLPRVSRARFDLQTSMMMELQQQLRELQKAVFRKDN